MVFWCERELMDNENFPMMLRSAISALAAYLPLPDAPLLPKRCHRVQFANRGLNTLAYFSIISP